MAVVLLGLLRVSSYFELLLEPLLQVFELLIYCEEVLPGTVPLYFLVLDDLAVSEPQRLAFIHVQPSPLLGNVDSVRNESVACGDFNHLLAPYGSGSESLHL